MPALARNEADAFLYEACDIPPGMTLAEYRSRRCRDRGRRGRGLVAWLRGKLWPAG
jgi:hypothetical protein